MVEETESQWTILLTFVSRKKYGRKGKWGRGVYMWRGPGPRTVEGRVTGVSGPVRRPGPEEGPTGVLGTVTGGTEGSPKRSKCASLSPRTFFTGTLVQ